MKTKIIRHCRCGRKATHIGFGMAWRLQEDINQTSLFEEEIQ